MKRTRTLTLLWVWWWVWWTPAASLAQAPPVYSGLTTSTYDGNQSGYTGVNALCRAEYGAGSRVCTADDILRIIGKKHQTTGAGWIASGPPGDVAGVTNDCAGFTSASASLYGRAWNWAANATGGEGTAVPCDGLIRIACCK